VPTQQELRDPTRTDTIVHEEIVAIYLGLLAIALPCQQLSPEALGGLWCTFGVVLEVDVDLHGVNAPDAVLFDGALEHVRIVRDRQPEIGKI